MSNDLASATSPYLRQHADNPVEWHPWGEAAFALARERGVPVLVSIGYSTCHWCHVMAHESFIDQACADLMNERLVCIKVDREEHPEVDAIYMDTVQALTGHGGWPLNAFTDADGRPFYACTYLPTPAWKRLIDHLSTLWTTDRAKVMRAASDITAHLKAQEQASAPALLDEDIWETLEDQLDRSYDQEHPGYAWNAHGAPKFPPSQLLALLLEARMPAVEAQAGAVLEAMQDSGLHERVGGGFHRYSVDRQWRVPHFEKMLYDNAQLIAAYTRAGVQLGRADFLRTACNAGDYLLRDLRVEQDGVLLGYASAEDADDAGGEGSFYAWSPDQLAGLLGEERARTLAAEWDLSPGPAHGSASGHGEPLASHIPHPRGSPVGPRGATAEAQALRESWEAFLPLLRARRVERPRPGRDDKVLTDQNGLALEAFALLGRYSGAERFISACRELSGVLIARLTADGLIRLPQRPAYITDYGSLLTGLLAAFDLLGDPALVRAGQRTAEEACARLRAEDGGFFTTPDGRTDLVRRGREVTDNAWPSGQSSLALGLVRLATITGGKRWLDLAQGIIAASAMVANQSPSACCTLLRAQLMVDRGALTAVVAGAAEDARTTLLLAACRRASVPGLAIIPVEECRAEAWAALEGRRDLKEPQALICMGTSCLAPAHNAMEVAERMDGALAMLHRK